MFPDPIIHWEPIKSIVDGLRNPYVTPVDADTGQYFSCVISGDNGGGISRLRDRREESFYSAIFDGPKILFGVEEMLYSVLTPEDGGTYRGDIYLKETRRSALLSTLKGDPLDRKFRHFLMVGGNTCFEIVASDEPTIQRHSSWDEAVGYLREKGRRL